MTTEEFNNQLLGFHDKLNYYAIRLTANKDNARDLLQETYLRAFSCKEQFANETNLIAWTFTIMRNTFINNYRKASQKRVIFDSTKDLFFLNQNKDILNITPDSEFRTKEINKAIETLEDVYKVPFRLYTQGYKYREIAQMLGIKEGTVKSRIFFARKKLSEKLEDYY
ncbi:MAG: RNA polymerase sigma factor [Bacteroidales bacterium]|jgi:RNA polymerase sigma-70 factor (ECF subfamily)|nr:RNA polymerase sigma factor [Bacteroidales bacterium]